MAEDVFDSSSESTPEGSSASPGGDLGSTEPDGKGRTLENLQRETQRKFEDLEGKMGLIVDGINKLTGLAANPQAPQPPVRQPQAAPQGQFPQVSQFGAPNPDLNQYSVGDLQQALTLNHWTPQQRQVLQAAANDKHLEAKADTLFADRERHAALTQARKESDEAASQSFPALDNPQSDFARRVETALVEERKLFGEHPRDRFNVANRVAREMGVEVARVVTPGYSAPASSNEPAPSADEPAMPSDDEIAVKAQDLKYAMPMRLNPKTGKLERVKFNKERLKSRIQNYAKDRPYYGTSKVSGRGN